MTFLSSCFSDWKVWVFVFGVFSFAYFLFPFFENFKIFFFFFFFDFLEMRLVSGRFFSSNVPKNAKVVIMGGGIIGNSIAYHLGKLGWGKETVLLEQNSITSGTTWHAAGLIVRFGSLSETSTEWRKYTRELYSSVLEKETGQPTGFNPVGFMEIATDKDRQFEYRKIAAFNRKLGVPVEEISASEVKRLFPLARTDDILSAFYVQGDGRANPVDAATSFSKGAKMQGVKVIEGIFQKKRKKKKNSSVCLFFLLSIRGCCCWNRAKKWPRFECFA